MERLPSGSDSDSEAPFDQSLIATAAPPSPAPLTSTLPADFRLSESPTLPPTPTPTPTGKQAAMQAAQDLASIGGGAYGMAANLPIPRNRNTNTQGVTQGATQGATQGELRPESATGGDPFSIQSPPQGAMLGGAGFAMPKTTQVLSSSPSAMPHMATSPGSTLPGSTPPSLSRSNVLAAELHTKADALYRLRSKAAPLEKKTRKLHDHVSKLSVSIQAMLDDFHEVSNDLSDLLPPGQGNAGVSHKVAATHLEVTNVVCVGIPSKIMPRFEKSLLGDLDTVMLHWLEQQGIFRKFHMKYEEFQRASTADEGANGGLGCSPMLKAETAGDEVRMLLHASFSGLTNVMETSSKMMDAWLYKYLQFQVHFWSETGQQIIGLQKSAGVLEGRLREEGIDPSESGTIMGEVKAETIVATPGWGLNEQVQVVKEEKGGVGAFFDKVTQGMRKEVVEEEGDKSYAKTEHKWLQGMFRRRNVDFFAKGKEGGVGGFDDCEGDDGEESRGASRAGSTNVSRRGSAENNGGGKGVDGNELKKKMEDLGKGLKGLFGGGGGGARSGDEFGSMNGLLGGGGVGVLDFKKEKGVGSSPRGSATGGMGGMKDMFSAFGSKNGEKEKSAGGSAVGGGTEWVDFEGAGGGDVAFDASRDI